MTSSFEYDESADEDEDDGDGFGRLVIVTLAALVAVVGGMLLFQGGTEVSAPVSCGSDGCTRGGWAWAGYLFFAGLPVFVVTLLLGWAAERRGGWPGAFTVAFGMAALSFVAGVALGLWARVS